MAGRTEARIFTSIWDDPHFLSLEEGPQRLYMFLLSQKELSYCGVLPLRESRWARKAAGLTLADVERYLKALEGTAYPTAYPDPDSAPTPLLVIDRDTEEVLARSLMRRDGIWKMPNLLKLAIEAAEQVESPRIRGALLAELRRIPLEETGSDLVRTLVADFILILEKGGPYPTPYPPPNPTDNASENGTAQDYARARGTGEEVTVEGDSPSPVPLFPGPLNAAPQDRKRGCRLPEDFTVTDEMRAWAARNAPHVNAGRETEQFRDYWRAETGARASKKDWPAAWQFWMRKAEDRQGPRTRSPQRPARGGASDDLSGEVYGQGRTTI